MFHQLTEGEDDSMRHWLNNFVSKEGMRGVWDYFVSDKKVYL
jgi:hypothetical protein